MNRNKQTHILGIVILMLISSMHPLYAAVDLSDSQPGVQERIPSSREMTVQSVVEAARQGSVAAIAAKASFVSSYWAWRSYQASKLPSLNLYGNIGSFNHSLTQLQNYETGELVYANNFNMQNSLGLAVSQNLSLTGGTISLFSDLSRIDQFGANRTNTWFTQPVTLSYTQPLFAYNSFKWNAKISPKEYEMAKSVYIEAMEEVTIEAVQDYFTLMLAKRNHEKAMVNYENTKTMYAVAEQRMKLGSVTRDECLQVELRMLNDSISINENYIKVKEAQMSLNSLLGYDESFEVEPVFEEDLPDVVMDYDFVIDKALKNSSFQTANDLKLLQSDASIARAKAEKGISVSLRAQFGLTKSSSTIKDAYHRPLDQEILGITFSMPVFDWGLGEGRVKKAKAEAELVRAEVEQAENDFRQTVFTAVGQFNNQKRQCQVSRRAVQIAGERYALMMDKFRAGTASVIELNTAQQENDEANDRYVTDLSNYWNYYFTIRKMTLYDYILGRDIDVDYNELLK